MIKIHILDCGSTTVDEALPFSNRSKNPFAYTGIGRSRQHKITVPVTAYLVEHPKGLLLVDTGWDIAIRENARNYEGFINYFASPGALPAGKAVTEHLQRLGYSIADIDYCILTHMDIDHAGGLGLVKQAKHIMVSNAEWKAAQSRNFRYLKRLWKDIEFQTFQDEEVDLFHDGTVILFPLHGHSAGMTGVKIGTSKKYVILAGDGGYGKPSWEDMVLSGILWNRNEAKKSLLKLHEYNNDKNCKAILATHDTEVKATTIEI